jgi:hypothetical protein
MSSGRNLLYVVGYPGSGKTTAVSTALGDEIVSVEREPFAHTVYAASIVELGFRRESFGGTDCLAMGVQPKVTQWLLGDAPAKLYGCSMVIGEGDRLGNGKFFQSVYNMGWRLTLVHLALPEVSARQRAWERGSRFNESWLKGRISKVDNLVSGDRLAFYRIDAMQPAETVGAELRYILEALHG